MAEDCRTTGLGQVGSGPLAGLLASLSMSCRGDPVILTILSIARHVRAWVRSGLPTIRCWVSRTAFASAPRRQRHGYAGGLWSDRTRAPDHAPVALPRPRQPRRAGAAGAQPLDQEDISNF
jgi:hypothetical protein